MALLLRIAFIFGFLHFGKGQDNSPKIPPLLVNKPVQSHSQYGMPMGSEGDPDSLEMLPGGWNPNQAMHNFERPNKPIHRPVGYGNPPMKLQEPVHDMGFDGLKPMEWSNRPMGVGDQLRPMGSIDINGENKPFHRPMGYGKPPKHHLKPFNDMDFDGPKPMEWSNRPMGISDPLRPMESVDINEEIEQFHRPMGYGKPPMHHERPFNDMDFDGPKPMEWSNRPTDSDNPSTWGMGFDGPSAQLEWQMKPKPIAFNGFQDMDRPRPSKAVMGLLKQLVNGKYRIMADALHIDAIPIEQNQDVGIIDLLPVDSMMPDILENQFIPSQAIATTDNAMAFEGNAGVPESLVSNSQQQSPLPDPNVESVNPHVVPLEVLLDEYQSLLKDIEENEQKDNKVSFEQLYQNYLTLLEKKQQKELNESAKNENTTTLSPTTTTTTVAPSTPSSTTPSQVTTAGSTDEPVKVLETEVPAITTEETPDFPNFNSFLQSPFHATYGDDGLMSLPGFENQIKNE